MYDLRPRQPRRHGPTFGSSPHYTHRHAPPGWTFRFLQRSSIIRGSGNCRGGVHQALGSQGLCPRAVRPPNSGGVRQGQRVPFCPSGRSDRYREWPIEHRRSQVCTCCTMKLLRSLYVQHFGPPVALNAFHNVRTRELIRLANCKLHEIALLGVAPDSMRPPL